MYSSYASEVYLLNIVQTVGEVRLVPADVSVIDVKEPQLSERNQNQASLTFLSTRMMLRVNGKMCTYQPSLILLVPKNSSTE